MENLSGDFTERYTEKLLEIKCLPHKACRESVTFSLTPQWPWRQTPVIWTCPSPWDQKIFGNSSILLPEFQTCLNTKYLPAYYSHGRGLLISMSAGYISSKRSWYFWPILIHYSHCILGAPASIICKSMNMKS